MRVARLHGPRDVRLHDEPEPDPADAEALLHVTAVGLCGSDRHWYADAAIGGVGLERSLILGHEIAAVIAAGPETGTRVAVEPAIPCETCPTCRAGRRELCPTAGFAGFGPTDGALREAMTWPRHLLRPIPDTIGDDDASLLEVLGIAIHALHLGGVEASSRVGVIGCGPIGLMVIHALRAAGVETIVAADPLPHRLAAATALGAVAVDAARLDAGRRGAGDLDVAIECAGEDAAIDDAVDLVRPGGRVVLVGIPDGERTSFPASAARRKGITFVLCRRMRPDDLGRAIELMASGAVRAGALVTHRYALDDVATAFDTLATRRGLKVVVRPGGRA